MCCVPGGELLLMTLLLVVISMLSAWWATLSDIWIFLSLTVPIAIVIIAICPSEPSAWPWWQFAVTLHPTPPLSPHCRYEILTPNAIPKGFMDGKQACEKMVSERWSACMCVCVCVCMVSRGGEGWAGNLPSPRPSASQPFPHPPRFRP